MVDPVSTSVVPVQRPQQQTAPANLKSNQKIAQTLLNQLQGVTSAASKSLSQTKPAGFSTTLPRGSLVDILA